MERSRTEQKSSVIWELKEVQAYLPSTNNVVHHDHDGKKL
jgi:hypothetical protein